MADHHVATRQPARPNFGSGLTRWFIRWSSSVTQWTNRRGACPAGKRQGSIEFVVAIEVDRHGRVSLEAWIDSTTGREAVLSEQEVDAQVSFDGTLMHVDVDRAGTRILAASIDPVHEQLLFAQCLLLEEAGLTAGMVDPPRLDLAPAEAASA